MRGFLFLRGPFRCVRTGGTIVGTPDAKPKPRVRNCYALSGLALGTYVPNSRERNAALSQHCL
jgi:hypothetical protein